MSICRVGVITGCERARFSRARGAGAQGQCVGGQGGARVAITSWFGLVGVVAGAQVRKGKRRRGRGGSRECLSAAQEGVASPAQKCGALRARKCGATAPCTLNTCSMRCAVWACMPTKCGATLASAASAFVGNNADSSAELRAAAAGAAACCCCGGSCHCCDCDCGCGCGCGCSWPASGCALARLPEAAAAAAQPDNTHRHSTAAVKLPRLHGALAALPSPLPPRRGKSEYQGTPPGGSGVRWIACRERRGREVWEGGWLGELDDGSV
eukprot:364371-Chlamydomonas_euryale.AAC.2